MKVLFVDDDWRRLERHVDELRDRGYTVTFESQVDPAIAILRDSANYFDLIILDISMPPGKEMFFQDTVGGTRTGVALYDLVRNLRPNVKIIALTNVPDKGVANYFHNEDPNLCRFVRKPEALPFRFGELVSEFLEDRPADNENANEQS
jgi:CheY-like chemotaxis protein